MFKRILSKPLCSITKSNNGQTKTKTSSTSPEQAFDACAYFPDTSTTSHLPPVATTQQFNQDGRERARQEVHASLREACNTADVSSVRQLVASLGADAHFIVNMAPNGANTLLFTACQVGCKEIVRVLLDNGADGRIHPITRYSPLYIACYHGHKDIVDMLLQKFPELIQQHTVEKWLPIHACCINGHNAVLEMLLNFPYPAHLMRTYRESSGQWQYQMAFDVNARDVTGQSVLYVACLLGNQHIVEMLLKFRVRAERARDHDSDDSNRDSTVLRDETIGTDTALVSPTRRRISDGIQSIMSRLSLRSGSTTAEDSTHVQQDCKETWVSPVHVDMYCHNDSETALHVAVKGRYYNIVSLLLHAGANPNLVIRRGAAGGGGGGADLEDSCRSTLGGVSSGGADEEVSGSGQPSTALVEACYHRDLALTELLLQYGARDDDCRALCVAAKNRDSTLTARLLSIKAHPDPEYKINKKTMTERVTSGCHLSNMFGNLSSGLTYSAIFPNVPVMINWHNQRCHLAQLRVDWLADAALHVNPKLRAAPSSTCTTALHAITRLDVSNNSLTSLPLHIFQLTSLRYLNVAQNKIEKLPAMEVTSPRRRRRHHHPGSSKSPEGYDCPVLEEIYLQDNRLEFVPDEVFLQLPALVTLVLANNKLQQLPYAMWRAPKLKELNVSFNLLKELPVEVVSSTPSSRTTAGDQSDRASITSTDSVMSKTTPMLEFSDTESRCSDVDGGVRRGGGQIYEVRYRNKHPSVRRVELTKHHVWTKSVDVTEQMFPSSADEQLLEQSSKLSALNLAHNLFSSVPAGLPCLAVSLTRLNLAYNNLRSMSHITSYPAALKQLDLSHNQITCWPSLPHLTHIHSDPTELANITCYCPNDATSKNQLPVLPNEFGGRSVRSAVLHSVCVHRRHLRLDNLRTLVLADNYLTRIQLSTDDDGDTIVNEDDENDWNMVSSGGSTGSKSRLMFPNLSMLDVSNNNLKEIPINIHELTNLSVLNVAGNVDISELPPQMGLLSRLWNLNTRGCALQEPLKSMIDSKKYKTMDIVGYLKSVLEDARPYARIKLMIVGVQGIGKTSLLEQLRQEGSGSSGSGGSGKHHPQHWAKRMGNKNINIKTSRGVNMSTVGVDIGDWLYEKKARGSQSVSHGPVLFRTWDFGGQKEYYATHQYFLSKRSLYLVVWRITDGLRGIDEILQWLVNIQARAPNSPCLIVGTHYDLHQPHRHPTCEQLQQTIRDRFINVVDAEKCGLPRVLDTIEVSCRTRHNIRLLCSLIYETVFSLRPPGSKELLLEQRVPATYLALEDVVTHLAAERRSLGLDPVLTADEYKLLVTQEMQAKCHRTFRDFGELHQATLFLHDNGVLLHYDDATLKDLYFLDPQWLCDMLAHVVTIREINPFARSGVMRLDDLQHVFKDHHDHHRGYIVNLLNKFEVALTWDARTLLIPSLLPTEDDVRNNVPGARVKVPVRSRGRAVRGKRLPLTTCAPPLPPAALSLHASQSEGSADEGASIKSKAEPEKCITRLLLMSYFPSGFWSRLISRVLADDSIVDIVRSFFVIPKEIVQDVQLTKLLDEVKAEWCLWQTGLQLTYGNITLFRMREVLPTSPAALYRALHFKLKQDGVWCDVDLVNSSILELVLPVETLLIQPGGDEAVITIEPSPESTAQLLALAVDHVDVLLEDWYPTLGTRFVHTSEGKFLVTRLIPCPRCLTHVNDLQHDMLPTSSSRANHSQHHLVQDAFRHMEVESILQQQRVRKSQESYTSECDSGVGPDSAGSSRMPSVEGHPVASVGDAASHHELVYSYSWMVEECILEAYSRKLVVCPTHGDVLLEKIAPDTIFMDLGERHLIRAENIKKGRLLGRGAFGFVFKGTYRARGGATVDVAMKMLQPVAPGSNARQSAVIAYRAAQGKWDRDPLQYACKAYCTARQELNILLTLRHPNIVPLVGVCVSPLALVLDLAPRGALDGVLRHYRRSGARVGPYALQAIVLQVARAIEYLHRQRIIYRDLKSENVLVWEMPPPFQDHPDQLVHIKVADYGISRLTLPSGTKGFGGTEGFMAPEIMRYNGEEEYTEKVDCFSFGMFIYELLTLHQPFEGHDSVKECVLEGGRPPLTRRETTTYPSYSLDLMAVCWAQAPRDRPTASQIVSIASAPEFTHLADVVSLPHGAPVTANTVVPITHITEEGLGGAEVWLTCANGRADLLLAGGGGWLQHHALMVPNRPSAACTVGPTVWLGDSLGNVHSYVAGDGVKLFTYKLEPDLSVPNSVIGLVYLPRLQRVACALANGRLFLVTSETAPSTPTAGEGSFVLTELGSSTALYSLCATTRAADMERGERVELWCGEGNGRISIYTLCEQAVIAHDVVEHGEGVGGSVLHLIAQGEQVWSSIHPGCTVYQWDVVGRTILHRLDCSKLVPCSESLNDDMERHLLGGQVTCVGVVGNEVYIGTTWGCLIIAERDSMRPITVFRPFEEEVRAIVPVLHSSRTTPFVVTVGRGYRSLITRYMDTTLTGITPTPDHIRAGPNNSYALLWRAEHWNTS